MKDKNKALARNVLIGTAMTLPIAVGYLGVHDPIVPGEGVEQPYIGVLNYIKFMAYMVSGIALGFTSLYAARKVDDNIKNLEYKLEKK